jgi:hypothetical protein
MVKITRKDLESIKCFVMEGSFNIGNRKLMYTQVGAMKVLVDNFAVLAIEYCLVDGLSGIFTSHAVIALDNTR